MQQNLGMESLVKILKDVEFIKKRYNLCFDSNRVAKADHALISFFDQVFDQGVNPAVPWLSYWYSNALCVAFKAILTF